MRRGGWVRVWDPAVRLLHWALVAGLGVAWLTPEHGDGRAHEIAGHAVAGLLLARAAWGWLAGPRSARMDRNVRVAMRLFRTRRARAGARGRYLGHNPAGSAMVLALLVGAGVAAFSGWLYTTDTFWGYGWLAAIHRWAGWGLLGLAALHVLGVLLTSIRERRNLVGAMLTGRKSRVPHGGR